MNIAATVSVIFEVFFVLVKTLVIIVADGLVLTINFAIVNPTIVLDITIVVANLNIIIDLNIVGHLTAADIIFEHFFIIELSELTKEMFVVADFLVIHFAVAELTIVV